MVGWISAIAAALGLAVALGFYRSARARKRVDRMLALRPQRTAAEFGAHYFGESASRAPLATRIREILDDLVEIDLAGLEPEDRFVEDLRIDALDSLAIVLLVQALEEAFDLSLPDRDMERIVNFRDLVDYIEGRLKNRMEADL